MNVPTYAPPSTVFLLKSTELHAQTFATTVALLHVAMLQLCRIYNYAQSMAMPTSTICGVSWVYVLYGHSNLPVLWVV